MAVRIRRPSPRRPARASLSVVGVGLAVAVALSACGGGDEGEAQDPREDGDGTTTSAETGSTAPPGRAPAEPECADGESAGRRYVLCTAGQAPDQPLIVALHGRGSSADEMRATTALEVPAAASGMAVVFPESLDGRWGDDTITTPARPAGDEDVAFLDSLVDDLRSDPRIDDRPVAVVGFSNGGSMAMRYAAARPDQTVAVVAVAGQLPRDPAVRPTGRVPLLAVYGTADPVRPYDTGIADDPQRTEGAPTPTLPTSESVAAFVDAAGGAPAHEGPTPSDPVPDDETSLSTERWSDDDGTVAVLVSVVGGGHTWPSALTPPPGGFGPVSGDLDASEAAVRFVAEAG